MQIDSEDDNEEFFLQTLAELRRLRLNADRNDTSEDSNVPPAVSGTERVDDAASAGEPQRELLATTSRLEDQMEIASPSRTSSSHLRSSPASLPQSSLANIQDLLATNSGDSNRDLLGVMNRLIGGFVNSQFERETPFTELINTIVISKEPDVLLSCLNELLEQLLVTNAISAERMFSSEKLCRGLLNVLQNPDFEEYEELQLITCRCFYNYLEVNSDFVVDALHNNAHEAIMKKIASITCIDLAEQALSCLEIMSKEDCLRSEILMYDGIATCLQNLDFFTTFAQRKASLIVANVCSAVTERHRLLIIRDFELLLSVIETSSDIIVKENLWLAIAKIIGSLHTGNAELEELFNSKALILPMLEKIQSSIKDQGNDPSTHEAHFKLIQAVIFLAQSSVKISSLLLENRVGQFITGCIEHFGNSMPTLAGSRAVTMEALAATPDGFLLSVMELITPIIPVTEEAAHTEVCKMDIQLRPLWVSNNEARLANCRKSEKAGFWEFVNDVWFILIRSFHATMEADVRRLALVGLLRICSFGDCDCLSIIVGFAELEDLLASVISSSVSAMKQLPLLSDDVMQGSSICNLEHLLCCVGTIKCLSLKMSGDWLNKMRKRGILESILWIEKNIGEPNELAVADSSTVLETPTRVPYLENFAFKTNEFPERCQLSPILKVFCREIYESFQARLSIDNGYPLGDFVESQLESTLQDIFRDSDGFRLNERWATAWRKMEEMLENGELSVYEEFASSFLSNLYSALRTSKCARDAFKDFVAEDLRFLELLTSFFQEYLNRIENFPIMGCFASGKTRKACSGMLSKQIRIRLVERRDSSQKLVNLKVHTLVTVKTLESFAGRSFNREPDLILTSDFKNRKESRSIYLQLNGSRMSKELTLLGAICSCSRLKSLDGIWSETHVIYVKSTEDVASSELDVSSWNEQLDCVLRCMKVIKTLVSGRFSDIFINWRVSVKLDKCLSDPWIVIGRGLPRWCFELVHSYPFLFPLSSRFRFLQSTSFGLARGLELFASKFEMRSGRADPYGTNLLGQYDSPGAGRTERMKVKISRKNIMLSAMKLFEIHGAAPQILEFEFFDEIGTGLGPTLEFYSCLSKEFHRRVLSMWRSTDYGDEDFVTSTNGLYPKPMSTSELCSENGKKVLSFFRLLGQFVARALLDSRILDLDLNEHFLALVLNDEIEDSDWSDLTEFRSSLMCQELMRIDPVLLKSVLRLIDLSESHPEVLDDLGLYFNLPECPSIDLIPHGSEIPLRVFNLNRYVRELSSFMSRGGVIEQVHSFKKGFSQIFPIESMNAFSVPELKSLFGRSEEDWSENTIKEAMKANHGYSQSSKTLEQLANTLSAFNLTERRQFLQFLTGAPKLPFGGFKSFKPEFTVVRKYPEEGVSGDDYLPSVMTCANYLKLPQYSLKSIMRQQILRAIKEGSGSFHLS